MNKPAELSAALALGWSLLLTLGLISMAVMVGALFGSSNVAIIVAGLFGGELLDPMGVPGIWFPFGIGVSRTQYIYAIALPLLAFLSVRTLSSQGTLRETHPH